MKRIGRIELGNRCSEQLVEVSRSPTGASMAFDAKSESMAMASVSEANWGVRGNVNLVLVPPWNP
ncbi:MAG: hypothetical protein ABSC63_02820 [Candidatus Binataceae bacterium]|jgi:hypothetical protein